jgi:hypothetical protein
MRLKCLIQRQWGWGEGERSSNFLTRISARTVRFLQFLRNKDGKENIRKANEGMQIWFPQIANRSFEVQWTMNLADPSSWQALDVPGNPPFSSEWIANSAWWTQTSTLWTRERLADFTACEFLSRRNPKIAGPVLRPIVA